MKVGSDAYFFIEVTWKASGKAKPFKHIVPCRGYNLKSQLRFNDSLFWVDSYKYYEVTKEQYEERVWGSLEVADTELKKSKTLSKSKPKNTAEKVKEPSRTKASVKRAPRGTKKQG